MLPRKRTVKVAVVGSGLAGLTAAYRMVKGSEHREVQVEVHLFEKVSLFFCHACTKGFPLPRFISWRPQDYESDFLLYAGLCLL